MPDPPICRVPSADEFHAMMQDRRRPPFIIDDIIPDPVEPGYSLLGGREGVGKSKFALQLAYAVASGESIMGLLTRRSVVAYLSFESSRFDLDYRIGLLNHQYPDAGTNIRVDNIDPIRLPARTHEFIELIRGAELVIIDNLQLNISGDYNKHNDAMAYIGALKKVSTEAHTSLLVVHHLRKQYRSNGRILAADADDLRGASCIKDLAITNILFEETSQPRGNTGHFRRRTGPELYEREITFWKVRLGHRLHRGDTIRLAFDPDTEMYREIRVATGITEQPERMEPPEQPVQPDQSPEPMSPDIPVARGSGHD
jgi:hypothetical protein